MAQFETSLTRFDGGINTTANVFDMASSESPDSRNVIYDSFGSVETVQGYTKLNEISKGPIDCLFAYSPDAADTRLLAISSGSLYEARGDSSTFTLVTRSTGLFTNNTPAYIVGYKNVAFISNGVSANYKYDGDTLTRWGVNVGNAPVASVTSNDGVLSGSYSYTIVGVNALTTRGNQSPSSATISVINKQARLTSLHVFPAIDGITTKLICRTRADEPGIYYVVDEVPNATVTYNDNIPDLDLTEEAPTDNEMPGRYTSTVLLKGIIFGVKPNTSLVYYSQAASPELWSTEDFLDINDGDGMVVTGLQVLSDGILVSKNNNTGNGSLYLIYMPSADDTNWSVQKLDSWVGGVAPKAMTIYNNRVAMINRNGVYDVHQSQPGIIAPDSLSFNIDKTIAGLDADNLYKATAISFQNKLYISVPGDNLVLIYDYVKGRAATGRDYGAWSIMDGSFNDFVIYKNSLYAGSSVDGSIYQLNDGYLFDTSNIDSYFTTAAIRGGKNVENNVKTWRTLWLMVEATGEFPMTIDAYTDFAKDRVFSAEVNLSSSEVSTWSDSEQSSRWGVMVWDEDPWYLGTTKPIDKKLVRVNLSNCKGKYIYFKFSVDGPERYFKLHNAKIEYNISGKR